MGALTVVAATIRLGSLATQSYWVDEATTVHELHMSFGGLLHALSVNESTPPLYYLLAWVWAKAFGSGEAGLRSLSALAGIALVPVSYLCGRELVSRAAGVVAAALVAVSPFMIWYAQEARAYMLFALLCGLSLWFFARARSEPSRGNLIGWAAFSALALMTHFFAGLLIAPEAALLLVRNRSRAVALAAGSLLVVQAALIPLAVNDTSHPLLGWITAFPRSIRIQQIPVDFGLGALYQSSVVTHGLLGAGVLAAVVAALLALGGSSSERSGATLAGGLAAVVIIVPIVVAVLGRDYVVPRNLTPAWIPLAVVLGAACTVSRARVAGSVLAVVLLGGFLWADVRIAQNPQYQRPDWRAVASALGTARVPRVIVAYDGGFAAQPLAVYMPGIPWVSQPSEVVSASEVDVVGSTWQSTPSRLAPGIRLLSRSAVNGFLVERFLIRPGWRLSLADFGRRAGALLGPGPASPAVLVQRPSARAT